MGAGLADAGDGEGTLGLYANLRAANTWIKDLNLREYDIRDGIMQSQETY